MAFGVINFFLFSASIDFTRPLSVPRIGGAYILPPYLSGAPYFSALLRPESALGRLFFVFSLEWNADYSGSQWLVSMVDTFPQCNGLGGHETRAGVVACEAKAVLGSTVVVYVSVFTR